MYFKEWTGESIFQQTLSTTNLFVTLENGVSVEEPDESGEDVNKSDNSHEPSRHTANKFEHTHAEKEESTKGKKKTL